MITLPPSVACKIESFLQGDNDHKKSEQGRLEGLGKSYETLSHRYREQAATPGFKDTAEGMAYAAARLPATYGAAHTVLSAVPKAVHLESLLDLGAGPGTATLAALPLFEGLKEVTLIEQDVSMHRLSQYLLEDQN